MDYLHLRHMYQTYGLYTYEEAHDRHLGEHLVRLCHVHIEHAALQGVTSLTLSLDDLLPNGSPFGLRPHITEATARTVGQHLAQRYGSAHVSLTQAGITKSGSPLFHLNVDWSVMPTIDLDPRWYVRWLPYVAGVYGLALYSVLGVEPLNEIE